MSKFTFWIIIFDDWLLRVIINDVITIELLMSGVTASIELLEDVAMKRIASELIISKALITCQLL